MDQAPTSGDLVDGAHRLPVRVYWEDTDAGGVIYHASFIRFMERGRTELLRALGLEQGKLRAEAGLLFLVRRMTIDYLRAGVIDDMLMVETRAARLGGATLTLKQVVLRGSEVLASAEVLCACVNLQGAPSRIPRGLRDAFSQASTGAMR